MHLYHKCLLAQANKNTLVKAMVGTGGVMAAVAFKAWWQPSFWAALSGGFDFRMRQPKFGLTLGTENYGNIRFVISELGSHFVTLAITCRACCPEVPASRTLCPYAVVRCVLFSQDCIQASAAALSACNPKLRV